MACALLKSGRQKLLLINFCCFSFHFNVRCTHTVFVVIYKMNISNNKWAGKKTEHQTKSGNLADSYCSFDCNSIFESFRNAFFFSLATLFFGWHSLFCLLFSRSFSTLRFRLNQVHQTDTIKSILFSLLRFAMFQTKYIHIHQSTLNLWHSHVAYFLVSS